MRCLIGQFQREYKKSKCGTGTGSDEAYESKWFGFKMLMFLKDKSKPKETTEAGIQKIHNNELESQLDITKDLSHNDNVSNQPTASSSNATPQPQTPARKRTLREAVLDKRQAEAYSVLQSLQRNAHQKDEYDVFGELIAKKIRKLDDNIKDQVMHEIDNIIFQAKSRMQPYNLLTPFNNYPQHFQNQYQQNSSIAATPSLQSSQSFLPSSNNYLRSSESSSSSLYSENQNSPQPFPNHHVQTQYSSTPPSSCSPNQCSPILSPPYSQNDSCQDESQQESETAFSNVRNFVTNFDPQEQ